MDHSATISSTGGVLEEEAEVNVSDLPAPVAAAVRNKYPNASIAEANTVTSNGPVMYEVIVRTGQTRREVTVSGAGEVKADKPKHRNPEKDED